MLLLGCCKRGPGRESASLRLSGLGLKTTSNEVVFPEYPELSEGKSALLRAGAKYASLSGSGSTLYGLFASREAAVQAVGRAAEAGMDGAGDEDAAAAGVLEASLLTLAASSAVSVNF